MADHKHSTGRIISKQKVCSNLQIYFLSIRHEVHTPGGPGGPRNPGGPAGPSSPGSPFNPGLPGKPSSPS
jgi:hypothetical protein